MLTKYLVQMHMFSMVCVQQIQLQGAYRTNSVYNITTILCAVCWRTHTVRRRIENRYQPVESESIFISNLLLDTTSLKLNGL